MSKAAALINRRVTERAQRFYADHADAYLFALDYCHRTAQKHRDADDVAAVAAAIVPAFIREGREDDRAAVRAACRRAVTRAAAAVARDYDADPVDLTDDTKTALPQYTPDPAAGFGVGALDYVAQALLHLDNETHRETMRLAAITAREQNTDTLTTAATPRGQREQITKAKADLRGLQGRILADPYGDGTGNRTRNDWTAHAATATVPALDYAAQVEAATLTALRDAAQDAAQQRDDLRVQIALGHMDGITDAALIAAHADATKEATRTAAGLAAAEAHAARTATRDNRRAAAHRITAQTMPTLDPAALSPASRPRQRIAKKDRPAQVPAWQYQGGTAHPDHSAIVAVRMLDTGTPGTELVRVEITGPDGTHWTTAYTDADGWTAQDTAQITRTLTRPGTTAADALTHAERILTRPGGAPKKPSRRAKNRTGGTGPTVPAYGMTR